MDQFSLQSPFRPSASRVFHTPGEDGNSYFSQSDSQPLLTPRKGTGLLNVAVGTKRKSSNIASNSSTPLRQRVLTPVGNVRGEHPDGTPSAFDRLAPLPAPRFTSLGPKSAAETEQAVSEHQQSISKLRLGGKHSWPHGFSSLGDDSDSACEPEDDGDSLFLGGLSSPRAQPSFAQKVSRHLLETKRVPRETTKTGATPMAGSSRVLNISIKPRSPKDMEEVAEAVSPGGHINKRRARSRPVSYELVETAKAELARSFRDTPLPHMSSLPHSASDAHIAFPARSPVETRFQPHTLSNSTSTPAEIGSPIPRRRINSTARSPQRRISGPSRGAIPGSSRPATCTTRSSLTRPPVPPLPRPGDSALSHAHTIGHNRRGPMPRVDSATLFFGPENTFSQEIATPQRPATTTAAAFSAPFGTPILTPQKPPRASDSMDSFDSPFGGIPSTEYNKRPPLDLGQSSYGRPSLAARHSYGGVGTPTSKASIPSLPLNLLASKNLPLNMLDARSKTPSPRSSPLTLANASPYEDDEDIFFGSSSFGTPHELPLGSSPLNVMGLDSPSESPWVVGSSSAVSVPSRLGPDRSFQLNNPSFAFSITAGTPSPRHKNNNGSSYLEPLKSKFQPRDSGVMMSSDEDHTPALSKAARPTPTLTPAHFLPRFPPTTTVMPAASTSVSTMDSLDDYTGLVTPGFEPASGSRWPNIHSGSSAEDLPYLPSDGDPDMDNAIVTVLNGRSCQSPVLPKQAIPGTPVKRPVRFAGARAWQTVDQPSRTHDFISAEAAAEKKKNKKPRASLPSAFPPLRTRRSKALDLAMAPEEEEEEEYDDSPSSRGKPRYGDVGMGRPGPSPSLVINPRGLAGLKGKAQRLMRRSSSGQFQAGGSDSGSASTTPTRVKGKDWHLPGTTFGLPSPPNAMKMSPVRAASRLTNGRSTSSSSTTSTIQSPLNSPTTRPRIAQPPSRPFQAKRESNDTSMLFPRRQKSSSFPSPTSPEVSRFERDFIELKEEGKGEFGAVIQVKYKDGRDEVTAVKRLKAFEGVRRRARAIEEATLLQELSEVTSRGLDGAPGRHPNVLAFLSSWEQDNTLYIQTELCERGNFAAFLVSFGRLWPSLDEGRLWKVMVDITNGLQFIHAAGIVHLDIKPANIFITADGRFKIGDFGIASHYPRPPDTDPLLGEREGDKFYLAPELLQGKWSKASDVFSFGLTMLEAAANVELPGEGPPWQRLRSDDFRQVKMPQHSTQLFDLIKGMMRKDPAMRTNLTNIANLPELCRARASMERVFEDAMRNNTSVYAASPLAPPPPGFLQEVLGHSISGVPHVDDMDLSP